jgi:hypothetical protein
VTPVLALLLPRRALGRRGAVLTVVGAIDVWPGGNAGHPGGWRGALIYGGVVALLLIIAGWREPPRFPEISP